MLRIRYFLLILSLVAAGLVVRRSAASLAFFGVYAPDAIWATMVYFLFAFILPRASSWKIALAALLFAFAIEFSQLYHAPWIDHLRSYRLGGLILGYGFLWSDLICYGVGVLGALMIDMLFKRRSILPDQ